MKGQSPLQSALALYFADQAIEEYFRERNIVQFDLIDERINTGRICSLDGQRCPPIPSEIKIDPLPFTDKEYKLLQERALRAFALMFGVEPRFL